MKVTSARTKVNIGIIHTSHDECSPTNESEWRSEGCKRSDVWKEGNAFICALHACQWSDRNHEFDHPPPHHYLHQPNTDMTSRNPISRGFKVLKQTFVKPFRKRNKSEDRKSDKPNKAGQKIPRRHSDGGNVVAIQRSSEGSDVDWKKVDLVGPPALTHSNGGEPAST